jgi:hypothetical protein
MIVYPRENNALKSASDSLQKIWNDMHDATVGDNFEQSTLFRIIKDLVWNTKELARHAKYSSI